MRDTRSTTHSFGDQGNRLGGTARSRSQKGRALHFEGTLGLSNNCQGCTNSIVFTIGIRRNIGGRG